MSRNSGGTYTAPSNSVNPAVEGTTIDEGDFNTLIDDIESALTDSLDRTGKGKITAHIDFDENGSPGTPASNVGRLYGGDDGGLTTLYWKDSSGNVYNLLQGAASGLTYQFSTSTTTTSDPGAGFIRFNNATISSVTEIAINDSTSAGANVSAFILTWDDSGTTDRGRLFIQKRTAPGTIAIFRISGALTDESGWTRLTVTYVTHAGSFSASDPIAVSFGTPGSQGATGSTGAAGSNGTDTGIRWLFDSSTTMADPGSGDLRLNHATFASVTAAAVSDNCAETGSPSVEAFVLSWDDSTTTALRGTLIIKKASAPENFAIFTITGSSTDNSGWTQLALTYVIASGSFSNGDTLAVQFTRTGAAGAGTGDVVGPSSSIDGELVLFNSTTGKLIKSATTTGVLKAASGVVSAASAGTDYYAPGSTDVAVADGGTGVSSLTAYAVMCGGTTSTSAVQSIASVGTSGQVLTSNGAGALPTFQNAAGGGTVNGILPRNVGLSVSAASSALTIALKGEDGNDPSGSNTVSLPFRSATATTGTITWRNVTAATSLTISSGSTIGVTSSTAFRIWIAAFDDGGTVRLGAINCATSTNITAIAAHGIASSTAEGGAGAADSAAVWYTGTAVTSKAYVVLGYIEWSATGLTAGTWTTTNLSRVQIFGPGIALPGASVQVVTATTNTGFSTTSSTYQTTTITASITPVSAANRIKVDMAAPCEVQASSQLAFGAIFRDSTRITGASGFYVAGSSINIAPWSQTVLDFPNTASSVTYAAKLRNLNNVATVLLPTSGVGEDPKGFTVLTEIAT